jgi:hypothetical protein
MNDKTYNGWTNYETWNVALWLDNDGSDTYWRERAEERVRESEEERFFTRAERAALDLADELKNEISENAPDLGASMFSDLLSAALSEVNWLEIARHYVDEVETDIVAEEETETADTDD